MIFLTSEMNKSTLDRSSKSVLDSYAAKFKLSRQNLEMLKTFIQDVSVAAAAFRDILNEQKAMLYDEIDNVEPIASQGDKEVLNNLKEVLDKVDNDLDDLQKETDDKLKCIEACYGGGQGGEACITNCELQCQNGEQCDFAAESCATDEAGCLSPSLPGPFH